MNQDQLFTPIRQPDKGITTIQKRFEEFDRLNPQVYQKLVEIARELVGEGHRHLGIGMIWEVLRFRYMKALGPVKTTETYELNNSFRSRYARKIMETEPNLAGVFEVRELHTP